LIPRTKSATNHPIGQLVATEQRINHLKAVVSPDVPDVNHGMANAQRSVAVNLKDTEVLNDGCARVHSLEPQNRFKVCHRLSPCFNNTSMAYH
jgi:hypothetical protein